MTTYYTYATKALDYQGNGLLETAYLNITEEMVFMAQLKGNFSGMTQGLHYQVVKQPKKIASTGNKAKRWVSQVCKATGLRRLSKAQELQNSHKINGIINKG